jgi:hypothetical protein
MIGTARGCLSSPLCNNICIAILTRYVTYVRISCWLVLYLLYHLYQQYGLLISLYQPPSYPSPRLGVTPSSRSKPGPSISHHFSSRAGSFPRATSSPAPPIPAGCRCLPTSGRSRSFKVVSHLIPRGIHFSRLVIKLESSPHLLVDLLLFRLQIRQGFRIGHVPATPPSPRKHVQLTLYPAVREHR